MNPEEATQAVRDGSRAVMRYASPDLRKWPHGWGKVIAYSDAPQVLIEDPTGEKVWWRADLTDLAPSTAPLTASDAGSGSQPHGDAAGRSGGRGGVIRVEIDLSLVTGADPMVRVPALIAEALHDLALLGPERLQVHRIVIEEADA